MDYFEEQEQKEKETLEEKKYQEMYQKQAKIAKLVLLITLGGTGFLFMILGIVFCFMEEAKEKYLHFVFIGLGDFFILLSIVLFLLIPQKGNYARYKRSVERFGGFNTYNMHFRIGLLEDRVKRLEEENAELKRKINSK
ncbi:MAG: hypothetical protein K2K15_05530 [Anaeroplasmataceae bacterium]|nr:hypothetical protein [Anaeroplasmataceae bacterium]